MRKRCDHQPAGADEPARYLQGVLLLIALAFLATAVPAQAAPGDLDPSFGTGGVVMSDFGIGRNERPRDVAVDAAGRTVVVGSSSVASEDAASLAAIARYTPSGVPDPTFGGGDGQVLLSTGPDAVSIARAVAVDTNGRVVVAGSACPDSLCETAKVAVARLTNSGQLDPSFGGSDGMMSTSVARSVTDMAVDAQGRIVMSSNTANLTVIRLTPGGALDSTFSGDGVATTGFNGSGYSYGFGMALDSQERIVVSGTAIENEEVDYAVARFLSNGALDSSFSGDGRVETDIGSLGNKDYQWAMAVDSQDRIVVTGNSFAPSLTGPNHLAMIRYAASGALDATFGDEGVVLSGDDFYNSAVAADSSDRVLVTGYHNGDVLARFQEDGSPDPAFGGGDGSTPVPFGILEGLTVDPQRRIVVSGNTSNGANNDFGVARFLSGDPVPPSQALSVSVGGPGVGDITGPGISCPGDCTESYAQGTPVALTASAATGSVFAGWSGDCTGQAGTCNLTMDVGRTVSANFQVAAAEPPPTPDPPAPPPAAPSSFPGESTRTTETKKSKLKRMKCRKGFKKRKVKGKVRCVVRHGRNKGKKHQHRAKRGSVNP